jgi:hypothetical protein
VISKHQHWLKKAQRKEKKRKEKKAKESKSLLKHRFQRAFSQAFAG